MGNQQGDNAEQRLTFGRYVLDLHRGCLLLDGREVNFDVAPPFTMTDGVNPLGLNRLFRMTIQPQRIENGEVVAIDGEFIDLAAQ